jgi:hypothetical protein
MPIGDDDSRSEAPLLNTSREPKRRAAAGEPGNIGQTALMDALILVGVAWLLVFFFAFSLRHHNI